MLFVREILLTCHGFFCGQNTQKKFGWLPLLAFFFIWHERNRTAFNKKEFWGHRMKFSFLCNYWSWRNLYIVDRPKYLFDFLTWLGCLVGVDEGGWIFFFVFPSPFLLTSLGAPFLDSLGAPRGFSF